jgi:glycosyltransferase involved in cell wall biosynthesis
MKRLIIRIDQFDPACYQIAARRFEESLRPLFHQTEYRPADATGVSRGLSVPPSADFTLVLHCALPNRFVRVRGGVNVGLVCCPTRRLPDFGKRQAPWLSFLEQMDALWVPNTHTMEALEAVGVSIPIKVIPCPPAVPASEVIAPPPCDLLDFDRSLPCERFWNWAARFQGARFGGTRFLMRWVGPVLQQIVRASWRVPRAGLPTRRPYVLCLAPDEPRHSLRWLLSEWAEFLKDRQDAPWDLVIRTCPARPDQRSIPALAALCQHVRALQHQFRLDKARVLISPGDPNGAEGLSLLDDADALVLAAVGDDFNLAVTDALAHGKPVIVPRLPAHDDVLPPAYPLRFATRLATLRLLGDPARDCDPASDWWVPEPLALSHALRQAAKLRQDGLARWGRCAADHWRERAGPGEIARRLAKEVGRLEAEGRPTWSATGSRSARTAYSTAERRVLVANRWLSCRAG